MTPALERAAARLREGGFTCVLQRDAQEYTSHLRGVRPLLDWLDAGVDMTGFVAADKVVGKAAAMLYVCLGVAAVYAPVMSAPARETLTAHGITACCDEVPASIRNRTDTGNCPMETAVWDITDPTAAQAAIRRRLAELNAPR